MCVYIFFIVPLDCFSWKLQYNVMLNEQDLRALSNALQVRLAEVQNCDSLVHLDLYKYCVQWEYRCYVPSLLPLKKKGKLNLRLLICLYVIHIVEHTLTNNCILTLRHFFFSLRYNTVIIPQTIGCPWNAKSFWTFKYLT